MQFDKARPLVNFLRLSKVYNFLFNLSIITTTAHACLLFTY
jgi:hypothetical protein